MLSEGPPDNTTQEYSEMLSKQHLVTFQQFLFWNS